MFKVNVNLSPRGIKTLSQGGAKLVGLCAILYRITGKK